AVLAAAMLTGRRTAAALLMTAAALSASGNGMADPGTGTPPNFGPYSWVEGSKIGVLTDNPESFSAIFVNSVNSDTTPPAGEWIPLKLARSDRRIAPRSRSFGTGAWDWVCRPVLCRSPHCVPSAKASSDVRDRPMILYRKVLFAFVV